MKRIKFILFGFLLSLVVQSCGEKSTNNDDKLKSAPWEDIEAIAEGTTVNFMMWQGSTAINDYINNYVVPSVKGKYNINLQISGGQGPEIVQLVMGEKQADIEQGQVDMVWINGETFFQLRKVKGLWGPFVEQLPNASLINFEDSYISTDFQQPVNGMEAPWSINQFAIVYDFEKVPNPPKNIPELKNFIKEHPGTFTISNDFTGMTLLKSFMAELGGGPNVLDGAFDENKYKQLSQKLWKFINDNKQYFWKEGSTFPKEQSKMNQLYANGELLIAYGFNEGGIEDKVLTGLYPESTKGYAWSNGTIRNSNYLGILYNSPEKAGAMQVINFLLSPEAQLKKADAKGMDSNTVLAMDKLDTEWKDKFLDARKRQYGPTLKELEVNAIAEPAPEYMIRLYEDFRKNVIEN
ncbi:ABC transporter substrate-binding protein [Zobellia barbeyronii]|uniref:ABC transporter substrate-binding protein n=1 Tax=Zobellia barbeyronii TaxID=2748009 RepID=A0ABS5WAE0_9FLAO|nr:ABC transporter substrate-binding protein [Zobellia barbeyronii]MBT2160359.1 ABC transporter substrate-binding protein [Zobellia barbeyronii]